MILCTYIWHFREPRDRSVNRLDLESASESLVCEAARYGQASEMFGPQAERQYDPVSLPRSLWDQTSGEAAVGQLWDAIPNNLRAPLRNSNPGDEIKICIASPLAAIGELPWEYLADAAQANGVSARLRIARTVPIAASPPSLSVQRPIRVLLVASNPKDERLMDTQRELALLQRSLSADAYCAQILTEPTLEGVRNALVSFQPTIVHFVGHAGVDHGAGMLVLHDPSSGTAWIGASTVAALLPISVRLMCLSTGVSAPNYDIRGLERFAQAPGELRLPSMIFNCRNLTENAAATFWLSFYSNIVAFGGDAAGAFFTAQDATRAVSVTEWGSFALIERSSGSKPFGLTEEADHARYADEIKALLSSRLTSELSERMSQLGEAGSDLFGDRLSEEASRFNELSARLGSKQ